MSTGLSTVVESQAVRIESRRQRLVLMVIVFAQLLVWLDNTILAIGLQVLSEPGTGLGATPGQLQWAISAYTLVFAALLFTGGALGDRFGHRTVMLGGLATFGAASVLAAYAPDAAWLITARVIMGVGSALIMPATLSVIAWNYTDLKARAGAIGVWSASSGVAVALGPVLGGALLGSFWWGSIFLINVPVVALSIAGVLAFVPAFRSEAARRFDWYAVVLSIAALVALVYGVIQGGNTADWTRPDVLVPIGCGVLLLGLFALIELRTPHASFDLRLLRGPHFLGGGLGVMFVFFGVTGQLFFSNFYLQGVRGFSPLTTGLSFLPNAVLLTATATSSGRIVRRFSVRWTATAGLLITALTFAAYSVFGLSTPMIWYELLMAAQGFGIGLIVAPLTAASIAAVPKERSGAGSALITAMRQVGGALGVAVLGSVLVMTYRHRIAPSLATLTPGLRSQAAASPTDTRQVAALAHSPGLIAAANNAYLHAMYVTSAAAALVTALGAVGVIVFFRRRNNRCTT